MNKIRVLAATVLATGLMGSLTAPTYAQGAKQFKKAMQNASQARLNRNGSNILRFDADQDAALNGISSFDSHLRVNTITVDDSLISNLDIDQNATVRQVSLTSSTANLNSVDMTRARSVMSEIDQDVTMRRVNAVYSNITANAISIR